MKNATWMGTAFLLCLMVLSNICPAQEKVITSSRCFTIQSGDIPLGNFHQPMQMPQDSLRINQRYNTLNGEGFWLNGNWVWGHDGLDTEGASETPGVNNVYAIQHGIVVLSWDKDDGGGWGESVAIATRANPFSEEIITHHYHHLHFNKGANKSTRKVNACDKVAVGLLIAKEGKTGTKGSHLHLTIRRWHNFDEMMEALKEGKLAFLGHGYSNDILSRIEKNLDPEGLLYDTYRDYQWSGQQPPHGWSLPYVKQVRESGIEFGLWDGRYGAGENATRADAARWLKIAARLESRFPSSPTFHDVSPDNPNFPYIEALTLFPAQNSVIDPDHTCKTDGHYFCPDTPVNRAEALKMIVMAFYADEYFKMYKGHIWENAYNVALSLLSSFEDVDPFSWYASYVYFGVQIGIVADNQYFNPAQEVKYEEMAKWITMGEQHIAATMDTACGNKTCAGDRFCNPENGACVKLPICVPTDGKECEVGGGYDPSTPPPPPPPPPPACECTDGACCDGCNYLPSGEVCDTEYDHRCAGPNQGQNAQERVVQFKCDILGHCSGDASYGNWYTYEDCSQTQVCEMVGGVPGCTDISEPPPPPPPPPTCECISGSGPCCDGCHFRSSTTPCSGRVEYRCAGPNPGQNAQKRYVFDYCDGVSLECNGQTVYESWTLSEDCSQTQVCEMSGSTSSCVDINEQPPPPPPPPPPTCECSSGSGPCCDGCNFVAAGNHCNVEDVLQCEGPNPGQDVLYHSTLTNCSGISSECDGEQLYGSTTYQDCTDNQVCEVVGGTPTCVDINEPPPPQCCTDGPCCDGCNYLPASVPCNTEYEYRCAGPNPGQDAQEQVVKTYCSGSSSSCNGQITYGGWFTHEDCSQAEVCEMVGSTPVCTGFCTDQFIASANSACDSNPQGSGNPTLCLYLQQVSSSNWEYQLCKSGGAFQENFTYYLKDDNHLVFFDQYAASAGTTCTPWRDFSLGYITASGPSNGAGLAAHVTSPAGCTPSACQYRTGSITVYKTCQ